MHLAIVEKINNNSQNISSKEKKKNENNTKNVTMKLGTRNLLVKGYIEAD